MIKTFFRLLIDPSKCREERGKKYWHNSIFFVTKEKFFKFSRFLKSNYYLKNYSLKKNFYICICILYYVKCVTNMRTQNEKKNNKLKIHIFRGRLIGKKKLKK